MTPVLTGIDEELANLRDLLAKGEVQLARACVQELAKRWPESAQVRHYARVLARPAASMRPGETEPSHDREYAWLRQHGSEHPGCWIAVLEDRLIAADPDFAVTLAAVRSSPDGERALLYFQPGVPN